MARKKKQQHTTTVPLHGEDGPTLIFTTSRTQTRALCDEINYNKRVAWHSNSELLTLEQLHEKVQHLFNQYIEDAKAQCSA